MNLGGLFRGDWQEHIADGFRGAPDIDLTDYANSRGLSYRGQRAQLGYVAAFPMTEDLQFNVLRGTLPGGEEGVLYHEVKLHEEGMTSGQFYGVQVEDTFQMKDLATLIPLVGEKHRYFRVPYTVCAIRVPQAQGAIVGLDIGRDKERVIHADRPGEGSNLPFVTGPQMWAGTKLDYVQLPGWRAAWRGRAQQEVIDQVLAGPIVQLLALARPLGFRAEFRYGTLILTQQHFLKTPEELDLHAQTASWLAGALRYICNAQAKPQPFDADLPPASWAEQIEKLPDDKFEGLDGQSFSKAHWIAKERGLVSEDPFEFHRAFCDMPVPGEAFAVFRGNLAGTSIRGRLVSALERRMFPPPPDWDRIVRLPDGQWGCDSVLFPVRGDVPDQHSDVGEIWGEQSRYAIRRGVFVAWRARLHSQTNGEEWDELATDALAFAGNEGLLTAAG